MKDTSVAFIGLGRMGAHMARHLLVAGFDLSVHNRSRGPAARLGEAGARVAQSPADAVAPGGIVVTVLANDAALEAVTLGEAGFAPALGAGGLHISMSTVAPETSRRLAREHERHGSSFVAAPVFGRPDAAAARKLWICQSGDEAAKQRARPVFEALGQGIFDFGTDPGAANVLKLCGNFLIFAAVEALAEAFALAEKAGLDRRALASFFGQTMFACPAYQNYGRIIAERTFDPPGFTMELGLKDMRLLRDSAEAAGVPMPIGDLLRARLLSGMAQGRGGLDFTAMEMSSSADAGMHQKAG
ncbi:MAG: NAD(P)-dependent oxidoreductase [Rhodocyclaceae bacterium]|nr:NAD(P)-dependent oxidoreductase [Rhodocyclaceae bacterium]MBX3669039.1 NAD(P)-dependent oxidoreductase [Rhodocyclaceae bacterium]